MLLEQRSFFTSLNPFLLLSIQEHHMYPAADPPQRAPGAPMPDLHIIFILVHRTGRGEKQDDDGNGNGTLSTLRPV